MKDYLRLLLLKEPGIFREQLADQNGVAQLMIRQQTLFI